MGNYLAIATTTATIAHLLKDISKTVIGTVVTTTPLDLATRTARDSLNVFLYNVTPCTAYMNLPERTDADGRQTIRPLALNLSYLLTALTADNNELKAQKILASAIGILDENAVLTREKILETIQGESEIAGSDLAEQVEVIRFSVQALSVEDMTNLWSMFFQTNYRISVAYQATAVLLGSKQTPITKSLVLEHPTRFATFKQPVIESVEPQILEWATNAKLTIIGRNLMADGVYVQFGTLKAVTPQTEDVTDNQISVAVPNELAAGVKLVQVVHPLMLGKPELEHRGYESNVAHFVLAPKITAADPISVSSGGDITLEFEPAVTPEQKVAVLIGDYTLPIPPRDPKSNPVKRFSVETPEDLPVGEYLLRLRVDGALSSLKVVEGQFVGPKVVVQ